MLSSAIGDLKLHLPRLSSQEVFNRVCPADGGNRYMYLHNVCAYIHVHVGVLVQYVHVLYRDLAK